MNRKLRTAAAGLALWAAGGGCDRGDPPAPASVAGRVLFRGRPLAGGAVVFAPDREKGTAGRAISAAVGADGNYHLSVDGSPAVPPGWYRVAIADPPAPPADAPAGPRFPPALRRPDRAGLDREVRPGRANVFDFVIEVPE